MSDDPDLQALIVPTQTAPPPPVGLPDVEAVVQHDAGPVS